MFRERRITSVSIRMYSLASNDLSRTVNTVYVMCKGFQRAINHYTLWTDFAVLFAMIR